MYLKKYKKFFFYYKKLQKKLFKFKNMSEKSDYTYEIYVNKYRKWFGTATTVKYERDCKKNQKNPT